jgi:hypothetical protein
MDKLLTAALDFAKYGFPVFPILANAKDPPLLKRWPERASTDPATIRKWWRRWPGANVAVATGGERRLLVIDIDPRNGGKVSRMEIEGEHSIPETAAVQTPSGGTHLWLLVPDGRELPGNSAGTKLGPGIDTRCVGGYVLVPPSRTPEGRYRWLNEATIAQAPAWILDWLEAVGDGERTPPEEWVELATSGVDEGQRNHSICRLAGKLFRHLPPVDAFLAQELIACWNLQRCRPPLDPQELSDILDGVALRELRRRQGGRP